MGATFEDIQKANKAIQTTDIKGKEYAEVNQRIKAFRMLYPTGFITTELVSNENGVCIFRATVGYVDNLDRVVLATGTAYEKEGSTFINKTSYIENCETSAVGRALGLAGLGIDTSVASAEEVLNAMENQKDKIDQKKQEVKTKQAELQSKIKMIKKYIKKEELMQKYMEYITSNKIHSEKDITEQHADALLKLLGESK